MVALCFSHHRNASIRPRLLARGDGSHVRINEFWATASIRPRLLARGDVIDTMLGPLRWRLQFGHACLRVETPTTADRIASSVVSFNSATPACAWRRHGFPVPRQIAEKLQFGHACLRVETRSKTLKPIQKRSLQFGHACLRVETLMQFRNKSFEEVASIRPRLLARGDSPCLRLLRTL